MGEMLGRVAPGIPAECDGPGGRRLRRDLTPARSLWHDRATMVTESRTLRPAASAERERVVVLLRAREGELRALGITRLALFGSLARGDAGPTSDVDLLIDIAPDSRLDLFDLVGLKDELGELLGREVSFAFETQLRPWLRKRIERDRVDIF
jgi:uncharacterized protein